MSGALRIVRPCGAALAALILMLATGPAPARAWMGNPRPPGTGKASQTVRRVDPAARPAAPSLRLRMTIRPRRPEGTRGSEGGADFPTLAAAEEGRGDDVESERGLSSALASPAGSPARRLHEPVGAMDARAGRRPYLLTAHLRF